MSGLWRNKGACGPAAGENHGQYPAEPACPVYGRVDTGYNDVPAILLEKRGKNASPVLDDGCIRRPCASGGEFHYQKLLSSGGTCGFIGIDKYHVLLKILILFQQLIKHGGQLRIAEHKVKCDQVKPFRHA